jgi:hypothetical protein
MEINIDNLHHANLIIGAWDRDPLVREILAILGVSRDNNPDLFIHEGPLGIDEARNISELISVRPFGEKRVLIIDAQEITPQAQNALLKTLEEPGEGNLFFFIVPYEDLLLPTLRSRMQKLTPTSLSALGPRGEVATNDAVAKFLNFSPAKRLDFAKRFKDGEKPLGPFLDVLLAHLKENKDTKNIEKVFEMRRFADDSGSDARLILEHLSLVLK